MVGLKVHIRRQQGLEGEAASGVSNQYPEHGHGWQASMTPQSGLSIGFHRVRAGLQSSNTARKKGDKRRQMVIISCSRKSMVPSKQLMNEYHQQYGEYPSSVIYFG